MHPPYGPKAVSPKGQVALPLELMRSSGLQAGDHVYVVEWDDPPGSILILPAEIAVQWFEGGRAKNARETPMKVSKDS
jgi:bifunctional DNA-binding transcriptional regulator/antitoxin component of YhaV-PrlF toxin-antitoxin module